MKITIGQEEVVTEYSVHVGGSDFGKIYDLTDMTKAKTQTSVWQKRRARLFIAVQLREGKIGPTEAQVLVNMLGVEKKHEHMPPVERYLHKKKIKNERKKK